MKPFLPDTLPLEDLDWAGLVPLIGKANAALARYDGLVQSIPNPDVLLAPLTIQEAVLSSRIEGTQATLEDVLAYEANPKKATPRTHDVEEVLNYRAALKHGVEALKERPFGLNLLQSMHGVLMEGVRGQNKSRGEFRRIQNWIGPPGSTIENASHIPPSPADVIPALSNLEAYYHSEERDHIVQLAILHAQFEIIHPFLDGNGRMGRLLVPLFLQDKGLLSGPLFYISAYFEADRPAYYRKLQAISQEGDWHGWIAFFLTAVVSQAERNTAQVRAILKLYGDLKGQIVELTRSQNAIFVLDFIFAHPLFSSTDFIEKTGIAKRTALRLLRTLAEADLLTVAEESRGTRSTLYVFRPLLEIVD